MTCLECHTEGYIAQASVVLKKITGIYNNPPEKRDTANKKYSCVRSGCHSVTEARQAHINVRPYMTSVANGCASCHVMHKTGTPAILTSSATNSGM